MLAVQIDFEICLQREKVDSLAGNRRREKKLLSKTGLSWQCKENALHFHIIIPY